ncbi:uncharacterized protein LOC135687351 isoform X2 [Rhopilema esculentum]|uniref:uncharacterized protein LOC135687351 isoform X2 n=1 Tax=Rhopilema esculentum TaxID=499914 RepID=UPI0031D0FF7D
MADGGTGFDRSHSFTWNFSILEGVMVKISDKFRPPNKIHLPIGWKSFEYEDDFEFDFKFEEDVIKLAEREQLQEESEKEYSSLVNATARSLDDNIEEASIDDNTDEDEDSLQKADGAASVFHNDVSETSILEPVKINSDPLAKQVNKNTSKCFNFSEFEDNFATPFELVELQTLDDINELKSVLQPGCKTNKRSKKTKSDDNVESQIDFSIFNTPVTTNQEPAEVKTSKIATASLIPDIEPVQSMATNTTLPLHLQFDQRQNEVLPVSSQPSASLQPGQPFDSLPVSSNYQNMNQFNHCQDITGQPNLGRFPDPVFKNSSLPFSGHIPLDMRFSTIKANDTRFSLDSVSHLEHGNSRIREFEHLGNLRGEQGKSLERDSAFFPKRNEGSDLDLKARGSLNKANSRSLPNLAEAGRMTENGVTGSASNCSQEPLLSTSRIDNIMRHFQLNRLREFNSSSNQNDPNATIENPLQNDTTQLPNVPKPQSGIVTSLQLSPRNLQFTTNQTFDSSTISAQQENSSMSDTERRMRFPSLQETNRRRRLSSSEPLPPIATPSPPRTSGAQHINTSSSLSKHSFKQEELSWLPDPTPNLSPQEASLANMITGMGFSKARTARAVERLEFDEKEIIDFLLRVQQISDLGYDADDVEMAIINNKNDNETILNYLSHTNKWKELGFPVQKVHDALINTDKENEAVFEYLTSLDE